MTAANARRHPHHDAPDRARSYEYALAPIERAEERVDRERRETSDELRALDRFAERVESTQTASCEPPPSPAIATVQQVRPASGQLESMREAYRETIMSVDHYERVYDEPLRENVEAELGPDIASGLCSDDAAFTPQFKRALLAAVATTRETREEYLGILQAETDSLSKARSVLEGVAETLSSCSGGRASKGNGLDDAIDRIDDVVTRRQEDLNQRVAHSRTNGHELCSYLLDEDQWTYPVLYAAASLKREAEALRRHYE
jgi:hypothetical protein